MNCLLQSLSMPQILSYLSVLFQPMQLMLDCLSVQFLSMSRIMNCQPGKPLRNFLCSLPRPLGPWMLCLSRVSQSSLGPNPCRGLQVCLLRRGGLLLRSGGLLLRRGGLLLRYGGLPLRLFQSGGLQLRRGGLMPCLLCIGGLLFCLLSRGGLLLHLLCPGGLHPGGLQSCLLRPGGLQFRPLRPGGLQFRRLRPGFLLCRLCLGPLPMDFLFLSAEYCIAYILAIATLRSPRSCYSLALLVFSCLIPAHVSWINPLPCHSDFVCTLLDYCLCTWIISLPCPVGYCSPIADLRLP